jgi:hypothetical protein
MVSLHHGKWTPGFGMCLFVIFGATKMILQYRTLQTSFPKLKKHSPTHLYMLYPMLQRFVRECVEIDMKRPSEVHCPWSSSIITIVENHFGARRAIGPMTDLNLEFSLQ